MVDHNNYFRSTIKKTTPKEDNSNMSTCLRIRVMVFIATFNNNSVKSWSQFYWWRKPTTCRKSLTNFIMLYRVHLHKICRLKTVNRYDIISSYKSQQLKITRINEKNPQTVIANNFINIIWRWGFFTTLRMLGTQIWWNQIG